jgi:hypothetical protein
VFGEPRCKLGSQGMVQLKDSIFLGGFKWVQIGS